MTGRDFFRDIDARGRERGTTLLELLVAMALLALLASYAFGAIRHLRSFDRAMRDIEDASSIEAVTAHMRRTIAGSRVVFFTTSGSQAKLAFVGEESRISLVADADNRLEWGGLYLVQIGFMEEEGERKLVAFRRVFRPAMDIEPGSRDPVLLADQVASLRFRYFGSPEKDAEAQWHATWTSMKTLPKAVEVILTFTNGRRWPPMVVAIPSAL